MKKLLILIMLFICVFAFGGCNQYEVDDNKYNLEVVDNWNLLVHPLEEKYEAGSTIEVHLAFRSGPSVGIIINDEVIVAKDYSTTCDPLCSVVSFTMPEENITIYTHQNGYIAKSCGDDNHTWDEGEIIQVPGGGEQLMYNCLVCGKTKTEDVNNEIQNIFIASHSGSYGTSSITLDEENKTFTYFFSIISSYIGRGTYEYKDGYLMLESEIDEQTWVFKIVDKALVFDLSLSDGHLWFTNVPEETAQLIYFSSNATEEEKIKATLEIGEGLRPMSSNDKIYTSYIKEFGPATSFILYGDAEVVWDETIEDIKFTYYDSGRIYIYYNGLIYTLTEAYEVGVLTLEDLANLLQVYAIREEFDNIPLETEIYFGPNYSWADEFESFFKDFNLFNSDHIINDYESYVDVYSKIPNTEFELLDEEWADEFFKSNLLIVKGRCVSGSVNYVPAVEYYYSTVNNEIIMKYKNQIGEVVGDVFIGYSIDIVTVPKDIYESIKIAKIVLDYEQNKKDFIEEMKNINPEYSYYFNPVDEVTCTYVFEDSDSINEVIEKYDLHNVFVGASISNLSSIKMLMIVFERELFSETVYQKICQIKDEEPYIKDFFITMEQVYINSYMPNIDYYTDDKEELEYKVEKNLFNTSDKSFIIKSKEEYDAYLDYLLEKAEYEYLKNNINSKRDLYDDSFFEENALIISKEIVRGSGSIKLTLDNLYIADNKVYIVIRTDEPIEGTCDMQCATFTFVVKKNDVINVTEVITLD